MHIHCCFVMYRYYCDEKKIVKSKFFTEHFFLFFPPVLYSLLLQPLRLHVRYVWALTAQRANSPYSQIGTLHKALQFRITARFQHVQRHLWEQDSVVSFFFRNRRGVNLTAFVCRLQAYDLYLSIFSSFPVGVVIAFFAREEGSLPAFMCSRAITHFGSALNMFSVTFGIKCGFLFFRQDRGDWSECLRLLGQHRQQTYHSFSAYSA